MRPFATWLIACSGGEFVGLRGALVIPRFLSFVSRAKAKLDLNQVLVRRTRSHWERGHDPVNPSTHSCVRTRTTVTQANRAVRALTSSFATSSRRRSFPPFLGIAVALRLGQGTSQLHVDVWWDCF